MIEEIKKKLFQEIEEEKIKTKSRRIYCDINPIDFAKLFQREAELIMLKQNNTNKFEPSTVKPILNQLYYYTIQDAERFNGSFDKGIYLEGNIGVGKTLIMTAYCNLLVRLKVKAKIYIQHSKSIIRDITQHPELIDETGNIFIKEKPVLGYAGRIMMIDDLGKEPALVNNYGTQTAPMEEIIVARYNNRTLTFATGNIKFDEFEMVYTKSVHERMKELFNVMVLTGKSKR